MALVGHVAGETLLVQIGNGASPEVFSHPCLINTSRALDLTATMSTTEIADCASPSNPAVIVRAPKSIDIKVTGAGVLDATSVLAYLQWWQAGTAKNVKIVQNLTGAQGGFTIAGAFVLTSFNQTGVRADKQTVTLTLEVSGAVTITQNA